MQDNSANRRKTLIISVLLFLFAGGGIFLFFVVQGSNDLTRQGPPVLRVDRFQRILAWFGRYCPAEQPAAAK